MLWKCMQTHTHIHSHATFILVHVRLCMRYGRLSIYYNEIVLMARKEREKETLLFASIAFAMHQLASTNEEIKLEFGFVFRLRLETRKRKIIFFLKATGIESLLFANVDFPFLLICKIYKEHHTCYYEYRQLWGLYLLFIFQRIVSKYIRFIVHRFMFTVGMCTFLCFSFLYIFFFVFGVGLLLFVAPAMQFNSSHDKRVFV